VRHASLGLAAIAALVAMAFIGTGSASATVLCETTPAEVEGVAVCQKGWGVKVGTIFQASAENIVFTTSKVDIACALSETEVKITSQGDGGKTVTGAITNLEFHECLTEASNKKCTIEAENLPYHAEIHWIESTHDGELTIKSSGEGNPGVIVSCAIDVEGLPKCTFADSLLHLQVIGGEPPHVTAEELPLEFQAGSGCFFKEAKIDATYEGVGETNEIWVAKEEANIEEPPVTSALCEAAPKEGVCPTGEVYSAEQEIKGEAENPFLVTSKEDVICEKSKATYKAKTAGAPTELAKGTITALTFESCKLTGGASCTIEAINMPYQTELSWTEGSNGALAVEKGEKGEPGATVTCVGGALACVFSAEPSLTIEGGNPAKAVAKEVTMKLSEKEGFLKCPAEATWSATYKATSPTAVYVARE